MTVLLAALPSQEHARWIADLGDPQRGEAAERALLGIGEKAVPPLQELLDAWDTTSPRELDRLRAALRTAELLGPAAAALAPTLTTLGRRKAHPLFPELAAARASLYPYAKDDAWPDLFHHGGFHEVGEAAKAELFTTFVRMAARSQVHGFDEAAAMRARLAGDELFVREVAAEALGRLGDAEALELLRARLADRERKPKGWDQVRHNGFVVPVEDRFALAAGEALARLAPDDARSAIGFGHVALRHPHRSVRRDALRALARFGPDSAAAVPELVQLALQEDQELAAEALKVLGMAGRDVGPHLLAIEALHARASGPVQKLAAGLLARLRAMGVTAATAPADAAAARARDAELAQAAAALSDATDEPVLAAERKLLAAGDAACPHLLARLRSEPRTVPDRVVRLLGRTGRTLPEAERLQLRYGLANQGETWSAPSMSTSSGGGGTMGAVRQEAYARLAIGTPDGLPGLAAFLGDANAAVRLAAARELASRAAEVAAGGDRPAAGTVQTRELLARAVRDDHPDESTFESGTNVRSSVRLDLDTPIQAAAAAALRDCEHTAEARLELLRKVLAHDDGPAVAAAIARWKSPAALAELTAASIDPRPEVAAAAAAALAELRPGK